MIRQIAFVVLIAVGLSASFGSVDQLLGPPSYKDARLILHHLVHDANITFHVRHSAYGYFALLYSDVMRNGDYTVVQIDDAGAVNVGDYHTGNRSSHEQPKPDLKSTFSLRVDHIHVIGWETDQLSHVTVKFTRRLNTGDPHDTVLKIGSTHPMCYAVRKGSKVLSMHEDGESPCFDLVVKENRGDSALSFKHRGRSNDTNQDTHSPQPHQSPRNKLHELMFKHGLAMTLAWCILTDFGVLILYCKQLRWRNIFHGFAFLMAGAMTTFTVTVMLREFNPQPSHMGMKQRLHYYIGLAVLGWVLLQVIIGFVLFLMFWRQVSAMMMLRIRQIHRWSGYLLILFAKVQVTLGWWMYRSQLAVLLVIADILLFLILLIYASNSESPPIASSNPNNTEPTKTNDLILSSTLQLYNSPLQKELPPYVIFDDWIYILENAFHPGGQLLIDKVRYREVDRYLYGMYPIQDYPGSPQHTHSSNSMNVLAQKIGRLPANSTYMMADSQSARIAISDRINERLVIFYVEANARYTQQHNLRHIGQYFRVKLQSYGKVRLYTAVCCLSQANRRNTQEMLRRLGVPMARNVILEDVTNRFQQMIPLVIRGYSQKDGFTKRIYELTQNTGQSAGHTLEISSLRGRGLCLDKVPYGTIVLFAGGTGLFPFLDLLDLIFKVMARTSIPNPQFNRYASLLNPYSFKLFIAVDREEQLVVPDQLAWMVRQRNPLFSMKLKLKNRTTNRFDSCLTSERFDDDFVRKEVIQEERYVQMVYVCGPVRLYQEVMGTLREHLFPEQKIYLV